MLIASLIQNFAHLKNIIKQLVKLTLCIFIVFYSLTVQASQTVKLGKFSIEKIDQYLMKAEAPYPDIVDGTQKHVRWYQGQHQKTEYSIVYLHGFSASSQELSPTTQLLADKLKANTYYTRLKGHGRSDDAMAQATVADWKRDTLEAYKIAELIGGKVIIISTSTGGTLATWLTNQKGIKQPYANIMISPNYEIASNTAWLLKSSLGFKIAKMINGDYNSFTPNSEAHAKYWTERYPLEAVRPMLALLDEVKELGKSIVTSPQLLIFSPTDRVIKVGAIKRVAKKFVNSETILLKFTESTDPHQHVLAGNACSIESTPLMVDTLYAYIEKLKK